MASPKEKLLQKFTEEYNRLNPEQRQAVDQIEGPVMVIAGPGTGKTQILSARIGKILLSDSMVEPSNILCLTYTDSGAVAMRRRLQGFIGPDAYRVAITTFHAFCNDVIQDNLGLFEKTALDPISDLERIELLKELIDGFGKDHPLKRYRGDVYFEINSLQNLFSLMKREGWTPDFICQKVTEYLNDLPNREEYICKRATKEYKKGDVRLDKIEEQKERMAKLQAACQEFQKFQQLMRARDRYDFDDMINWVINAFETNENLLRAYQEQYQYILVDEYQDTSGSQNRIVQLLINFWDKPNVFVVGDDDQSIYRFQGANVENMLQFAEAYAADLLKVVLVNNYRSTQPILDVSRTLIENNQERLVRKIEGLTKQLIAASASTVHSPRSTDPSSVEGYSLHVAGSERVTSHTSGITHPSLLEFETQRDEMMGITLRIEKLIRAGVPGHQIGVIYRENKYGEELANYLRLKQIPFYSKRSLNILDQPFVQQLLLVLDYLNAEHDIPYSGDEMLFEILHLEWLDIPAIEIARATMMVSELKYKGHNTSLRQWLCEQSSKPPQDLFDAGLHKGLKEACTVMEALVTAVSNHTLQTLLEKIVRELGFLGYLINQPEKHWLMQLLSGFYDHVKEESRRHPNLTLQEFMNRIALMRKEGLILPLVQVSGNEKGVNLLTCHGSKGLEFEYVFFTGVTSNSWEKKRKPYSGYPMPDTLFSYASAPADKAASEAEEMRRLFYVAITRAKKQLYLSYPNYTNEGKQLEPTMYLAEIQQEHELPREKVIITPEESMDFSILQFSGSLAPEVPHLDDDLVDRVVNGFSMNVSALNNYLRCPLGFFYQNIVRIPSPRNEAAEFGSAVHYALEQLFKKMRERGKFAHLDDFLNDFAWWMKRHRESFTREQYNRRLEYGLQILTNYYNSYINQWNKIVAVELNVRNVLLDEIPLKGKIDKIEFNGKDAIVIDYKTGDPEKCADKFLRPGHKEPSGGDYWRQAVFYKIMLDLYPKEWNVTGVEFDFVEPDKAKKYRKERVAIGSIDIDLVKDQIKTVWEKVQRKDFYTGCGKEDCHWCNFVKTNKLHIALHELKSEEEEMGRNYMRVVD
ncbi:MAG TPA: ATP-dependent DNA helicase [Flavisolibacter sp.]|jgi:DNA helicase-2/ATP-dependent DNA helicase PcrA|nr:ATP-dependent DNA helicase [Flavisolibacter sp.]